MPLSLYKRGKIWHYRGTVAGRRLRGSAGTQDKTIAERVVSDIEQRQWKGHLDGPSAVLTFAQASILYRQAGRATRFLDRIEDYWRDTLVRDINGGAVRRAAITLYPKAKGSTRNRQVIIPTMAVINHAAENDLCQPVRVKRFPVETKVKTPATLAWVRAFMANANPHLGALCCFMFLTAARISEAVDVRWGDLDLAATTVLIRQTKVGRERIAHLPPPLVAAIANIEGERRPRDKVFKYSSRDTVMPQWRKVLRRGKLTPLTPHCCRHGFATSLLHAGVDIITIAKLGGWESPDHVFRTYGHAREDKTLVNLIIEQAAGNATDTKVLRNS